MAGKRRSSGRGRGRRKVDEEVAEDPSDHEEEEEEEEPVAREQDDDEEEEDGESGGDEDEEPRPSKKTRGTKSRRRTGTSSGTKRANDEDDEDEEEAEESDADADASEEEYERDDDADEEEDDEGEDREAAAEEAAEEADELRAERKRDKKNNKRRKKNDAGPSSPSPANHAREEMASPIRQVNPPGRPAEAGIVRSVYVENFMCHRKLTVDLCRNVNFIHGQNGSGKSAVLAAVQICLGAGARRTHRARNLKDLIRKGGDASSTQGAKVRVTLLNQGNDAYEREKYGDEITVERCIAGSGGGYNGYKLLDRDGREVSRAKKDLDTMLDQLNIQVENPVCVLDQEEAKKFLTGKPEDKYAFFAKATDLERMDRSYAAVSDNIEDLQETNDRIRNSLGAASDNVKALEKEWKQFQELGKLEETILENRISYVWSAVREVEVGVAEKEQTLQNLKDKQAKRTEELAKVMEAADGDQGDGGALDERLAQLTEEAQEAAETKSELDEKLREALAPIKAKENQLKQCKREQNSAGRGLQQARRHLKDARDQIVQMAGSAESDEARRTEKLRKGEEELAELNSGLDEKKVNLAKYLKEYDELEPHVEQAKANLDGVTSQYQTVNKRMRDLQSSAENSLAMFGQKCVVMREKVEKAQRDRKFRGPVIGPIGAYIKIAPGKERFAKVAEKALGGGVLDRFICTNDDDRKTYMALRREAGCGNRDCGAYQMSGVGARYNVPDPPCPQIETVASTLAVSDDLVFNCLVDNCNIDQIALAGSKEESEEALLMKSNDGRDAIRGGGAIKSVYFLPHADYWQVKRGFRTMISNDNPNRMRQTIGIDRSAAVEEARREAEILKEEMSDVKAKHSESAQRAKSAKIKWNNENKAMKQSMKRIEKLQTDIEDLKSEAENAESVAIDTTELEEDVKSAEEAVAELKAKESELVASIEELTPLVDTTKQKYEEVTARNEKVLTDITSVEKEIEKGVRSAAQRQANIQKRQAKLAKFEDAIQDVASEVESKREKLLESLQKARILTLKTKKEMQQRQSLGGEGGENENDNPNVSDETSMTFSPTELEAVEPVRTNKDPSFYKAKIERGMKQVERERERRQISEVDPAVLLEKYHRAKKQLDSKMHQIDTITANIEVLVADVRERKQKWRMFRKHLAMTTSNTFDELLNKKGSSGELEFDHEDGKLNLIVQKDNTNEMSQTKDVKALSGGERSFTTLSLLLALGESLETPFRVMDEFDVFLDPVSRKIALDTMVSIAKEMVNRQFIFITPQDLSSLKADPMLKIIKMRPPDRDSNGRSQQTINFGT